MTSTATIKPFRGVRYNPRRISDLSRVVSQPHDRVRPGLRDEYYDLSPYNVVRVIKGRERPKDGGKHNVYTRAREAYRSWRRQGILMQEELPALYVIQQQFTLPDGSKKSRLGLIAALELSRYDKGIVLPHERTFSHSMTGRFSLLQDTGVNFGSVLMLYPGGGINELLEPIVRQPPAFEVRELLECDVLQRFWVVTAPDVITAIVEEMSTKRNLVIADGHHRYETALRYRDGMRTKHPDAPSNASFNYRLVTLVSMEDPGLVILPTHRLIRSHGKMEMGRASAFERAAKYFEVTEVESRAALEQAIRGRSIVRVLWAAQRNVGGSQAARYGHYGASLARSFSFMAHA